jgi:hypothetical protein
LRNGFSPWIRAQGGICLMKRSQGRKSRETVPLMQI